MSDSPRLFSLNALFDLELGGYPVESVRAGALCMEPLFGFCGTEQDRVLLDCGIPDGYWRYLDETRIPHALPYSPNDAAKARAFAGTPWGWNRKIADRFVEIGVRIEHPDLSVVRTVNSRAFCAAFNRESGTGVPGTTLCTTLAQVRGAVDALRENMPLVAKPVFGGSGFGFVSIAKPTDIDGSAADGIGRLVAQHGCIIEPWCERRADLSTSCDIGRDGKVSNLRHYQCSVNRRGAFFGVVPGECGAFIVRYRDELASSALKACAALTAAGYFGPVSFDSFVYGDATLGSGSLALVI